MSEKYVGWEWRYAIQTMARECGKRVLSDTEKQRATRSGGDASDARYISDLGCFLGDPLFPNPIHMSPLQMLHDSRQL